MTGFYGRYVLPKLVDHACGSARIRRQRQIVVPLARGCVLEIGIGTGLNLPFYDPARVDRIIGLEPSDEMLRLARRRAEGLAIPIEFLALEGERIPLDRHSVDTVLVTYTLCTIAGVAAALDGMRRVLRPGGRLVFCEHGRAPDEAVRRLQDRLNPVWRRIGGGCNLNRDIPGLIEESGFAVDRLERGYLPAMPRFAGFNYWGTADPR